MFFVFNSPYNPDPTKLTGSDGLDEMFHTPVDHARRRTLFSIPESPEVPRWAYGISGVLESRCWEGNGEGGRVWTHSGAYRRTMVSEEASKPHILRPKPKSPTCCWIIMGKQPQTFNGTLPYFSWDFISFYSILKSILFIFLLSPEHMTCVFS